MNDIRKICVVITARPSYSRIKTALKAFVDNPALELQLVVAGSALLDRYGTAVDFIEEDGFKIDGRVFMVLEGENPTSMAKTTGLGILELATTFDNLKPDMVISIADRYETIATAIASSYMNIPLVHVQGGEVTGNIDEKVRHAVTKLADVHLVASDMAKKRVIRMGENPKFVFKTGCPSIDLAAEIMENPSLNFDPMEKYGGVGALIDISKGYLVVMQHPVTTEYDESRNHVTESLKAIDNIGIPTLWFWPNVDAGSDGTSAGIRSFREIYHPKNIHFFKNMEPTDFLRLLYNCKCLVGNSSVGIRESAFLGVPVVNVGTRQNGRERGNNVQDVGYSSEQIQEAISRHLIQDRPAPSEVYGNGNAGNKMSEILSTIPLTITKRLEY